MTATTQQTCRDTQQALSRWQGGYARIWEFNPSLDTLTIRVVHEDRAGNLHIVCSPCLRLSGPVHWENCQLRVSCSEEPNGDTIFDVRDESGTFQALCLGVAVQENVEPLY